VYPVLSADDLPGFLEKLEGLRAIRSQSLA
jgi:hypothetical protein